MNKVNLTQEIKAIKNKTAYGESTDDEMIGDELDKVYEQNKEVIARKLDESRMLASEYSGGMSKHDATLNFIRKRDA